MTGIYLLILLGSSQAQKIRGLPEFACCELKTGTHLWQDRYLLLSSFAGALCGLLVGDAAAARSPRSSQLHREPQGASLMLIKREDQGLDFSCLPFM